MQLCWLSLRGRRAHDGVKLRMIFRHPVSSLSWVFSGREALDEEPLGLTDCCESDCIGSGPTGPVLLMILILEAQFLTFSFLEDIKY